MSRCDSKLTHSHLLSNFAANMMVLDLHVGQIMATCDFFVLNTSLFSYCENKNISSDKSQIRLKNTPHNFVTSPTTHTHSNRLWEILQTSHLLLIWFYFPFACCTPIYYKRGIFPVLAFDFFQILLLIRGFLRIFIVFVETRLSWVGSCSCCAL